MKKNIKIADISKGVDEILSPVVAEDFVELPPPYDKIEEELKWKEITPEQKERLVCNLDGIIATNLPRPKNEKKKKDMLIYLSRVLKNS